MVNLVKKANARMQLLTKIASFNATREDLKNIYITFIRSVLEQSAVVWHTSLTQQNSEDLERIQKSAMKIIMNNEYKGYKQSLIELDLQNLYDRREGLLLNFGLKCLKSDKSKIHFPPTHKKHTMKTRKTNTFQEQKCSKARLSNSTIPQLQKRLNEYYKNNTQT